MVSQWKLLIELFIPIILCGDTHLTLVITAQMSTPWCVLVLSFLPLSKGSWTHFGSHHQSWYLITRNAELSSQRDFYPDISHEESKRCLVGLKLSSEASGRGESCDLFMQDKGSFRDGSLNSSHQLFFLDLCIWHIKTHQGRQIYMIILYVADLKWLTGVVSYQYFWGWHRLLFILCLIALHCQVVVRTNKSLFVLEMITIPLQG